MPRIVFAEQSALSVGGHYFTYTRTIANAARTLGYDVTILQNQQFQGTWDIDGADVISAFQYTWAEADVTWLRDWKPGNIAYDLETALAARPPAQGDHVLFSTISLAEMRALIDYFVELPVGVPHPTYHLLLRYDPLVLQDNLEHYRALFQRVRRSALLRKNLRFYTDTDLLSNSYTRATGLPFSTLPIPFDHAYLKAHLSERPDPAKPLVVTYLGDARLEKNFALIPDAVASLWDSHLSPGLARFVLQSNFNVAGGETGMLQAVQSLGQYPPNAVEMIELPMQPSAYYRRLAEADIVLIPYEPERYRERSSGILIEAMAAGKPVVTTRGSWMESQVDGEHAVLFDARKGNLADAVRSAIDDFERLKLGAERISSQWVARSSGEHFIERLVESAAEIPALAGRPHVLVIVEGEALILRNGAGLVARNQLRYLTSANYRVTVLALMRRRHATLEQVDGWFSEVQERLCEFDLEGIFVAGAGRLSAESRAQRKRPSEYTIANDVAETAGFDIGMDLLRHVRSHRPDAVLMNYVVNWPLVEALGLIDCPVICETVDIQSFQKAIYGKRRISSEDLQTEKELLSRCRHLISISHSETAILKTMLPDAAVTTAGVFPEIRAPSVRYLAGATSLGEVVSSCGPASADYSWNDAWERGATEEVLRLARKSSLDLIYVSSNHAANVSGLKWFLDNVYLPILAPAGVTMAVAGSISEWGGWPSHENLFILGRLERIEPLYAASKIAVVPIIEGAGAAVKTLEALAHGCPTVATPAAMRGIVGNVAGVEVVQTVEEMRTAIERLLSSDELRRQQGAAALASAQRLASPARYAELLNSAFQEVLGPKALCSLGGEPPAAVAPSLCWGPMIERINRLVRLWLGGETFEYASLERLAAMPRDEVATVLDDVLKALLVDRDAAVLDTEPAVLRLIGRRRYEEAMIGRQVVLAAIAMIGATGSPAPVEDEAPVVFAADLPVSLAMLSTQLGASWQSGDATVALDGREIDGLTTATAQSVSSHKSSLQFAKLSFSGRLRGAVITQVAQIGGKTLQQRRVLQEGEALGASVLLKPGATVRLTLPELYSPVWTGRIVDLVVQSLGSLDLNVEVNGDQVVPQRLVSGEHQVIRLVLPRLTSEPTEVILTILSGSGMLHEAANRLLLGPGGEDVLALVDQAATTNASPVSPTVAKPETVRLMLGELAASVRNQTALSRARLRATRKLIGEKGTLASLEELLAEPSAGLEPVLSTPSELATLLEPNRFLAARAESNAHLLVASCGLSMEVRATLLNPQHVIGCSCLVDGRPAALVSQTKASFIWRAVGRAPDQSDTWLRRVAIVGADNRRLDTDSVEAVFRFVAGSDRKTGNRFLRLSNTHEPTIYSEDVGCVWTGPGRRLSMGIPLLCKGGRLKINLANVGENREPQDIAVACNGIPLDLEFDHHLADEMFLSGSLPADGEGLAATELTLTTAKLFSPFGDTRRLGVAINYIELSLPLPLGSLPERSTV